MEDATETFKNILKKAEESFVFSVICTANERDLTSVILTF